jgi:4-phytase/acid phosphatase
MLARLLCALLFIAPALAQNQLKMVVILTRHGVRSPTGAAYVKAPWPKLQPDWGVDCCGDLTPTGKQLVRLMGAYYRDYYAQLLPPGCPDKQVYIRADNEERTMETGRELAKGLEGDSTRCNIPVHSAGYKPQPCNTSGGNCQRGKPTDPLFHLPSSYKPDVNRMQAIARHINQSYPGLREKYSRQLEALRKTLCPSENCTPIPEKPAAVDSNGKLTWDGPFSAGSTASEIFLLEYGNGMPCEKVGWGRVIFNSPDCSGPGQLFRDMQEIHTAYFQEMQRAHYIAQMQGFNLLNEIASRLNQGTGPTAPQQKLVILAGHDTNIANIAGIFDFKWKPCDLPENDTPPAGALVFELYKDPQQTGYSVRVRYVYQKVEQLRTKAKLTRTSPPQWLEVALITCKNNDCDIRKLDKSAIKPAGDQQAACTGPADK